jgi:hypothetical protein
MTVIEGGSSISGRTKTIHWRHSSNNKLQQHSPARAQTKKEWAHSRRSCPQSGEGWPRTTSHFETAAAGSQGKEIRSRAQKSVCWFSKEGSSTAQTPHPDDEDQPARHACTQVASTDLFCASLFISPLMLSLSGLSVVCPLG